MKMRPFLPARAETTNHQSSKMWLNYIWIQYQQGEERKQNNKRRKPLSVRFGHPLKLVSVNLVSMSRSSRLEPSVNFKRVGEKNPIIN